MGCYGSSTPTRRSGIFVNVIPGEDFGCLAHFAQQRGDLLGFQAVELGSLARDVRGLFLWYEGELGVSFDKGLIERGQFITTY